MSDFGNESLLKVLSVRKLEQNLSTIESCFHLWAECQFLTSLIPGLEGEGSRRGTLFESDKVKYRDYAKNQETAFLLTSSFASSQQQQNQHHVSLEW